MKTDSMKATKPSFTLDVQKVREDGSFYCPCCGKTISPDDNTDDNYTLLEPSVVNGELKRLTLLCHGCNSVIALENFLFVSKNTVEKKERG